MFCTKQLFVALFVCTFVKRDKSNSYNDVCRFFLQSKSGFEVRGRGGCGCVTVLTYCGGKIKSTLAQEASVVKALAQC